MDIFGLHRQVKHQMQSTNQTDTPVIAKDIATGKMYTLLAPLEYEPTSDDGEGNATSTGPTFWLMIEEM